MVQAHFVIYAYQGQSATSNWVVFSDSPKRRAIRPIEPLTLRLSSPGSGSA